ncbi:DNA sulfur modification protein DndB [Gottschalkiaceae bacterium SANA]|nr:DNA sulfur modification protein DndB [Gottschalkiaceae bacterium SANA]
MESNFNYSFPAIRGEQAGRDYYVIMCPLAILPKLFIFNEEIKELPPDLRAQRTINENRIPDIADYILNNRKDYVFSSLTASVDGDLQFTPATTENFSDVGLLQISMDSRLLINDGQHRKYAIEAALEADPSLKTESISVVLFHDEGLRRSQQLFSDLNKHAVNASRSIGILYDSRDPIAILTKELLQHSTKLEKLTEKENSSLPKYSNKLFLLSNLYSANQKLIGKEDPGDPKIKTFIINYWDFLLDTVFEWKAVINKESTPFNTRASSIISYGVVIEALGLIGADLYQSNKKNWKKQLKRINDVDWSRTNRGDWEGRCISENGRITKSSKNTRLTAVRVKQLLEIPLKDSEQLLEDSFAKEK